MRAMILGAGGMLGRDLSATAPPAARVTPLTRSDLDITDTASVARAIRDLRPDAIVNAAAYTLVDQAESERDLAFRVNGEALAAIARAALDTRAVLVHFSTDYVFDGTSHLPYSEDASPSPVNVYGASKLAGEDRLLESGAAHLLIRTQWLFGVPGRSFPRTMWERACRGQVTRVVADQTGRPTYSEDLARAVWLLLSRGARGLLHVANTGAATWYDVARRVFSKIDLAHLLTPCTTAEYSTPARRPVSSVLHTAKAEALLGGPLPPWTDAVDRFIDEIAASGQRTASGRSGPWPAGTARRSR